MPSSGAGRARVRAACPDSPHGKDHVRIYAEHRLRPVFFHPRDLEAHVERRSTA
ncbi:MAG TPA: hypothetical protein VK886_13210 [Vicinamibacterales bacterium]|nr:hypothetical protein [Vicinamibacterales bacterium]